MKAWRYLDLAKLISLIDTKKLFFSRMDLLEDPIEGVIPNGVLKMLMERSLDSGVSAGLYMAQFHQLSEDFRKYTFVNCWHESDIESEAMWALYSNRQKGIAIVSTRDNLADSLPQRVSLGNVEYIDFNSDDVKIVHPYFYKRASFQHEKELRAVVIDKKANSTGISISVELWPQMTVGIQFAIVERNSADIFTVSSTSRTGVSEMSLPESPNPLIDRSFHLRFL